MVEFYRGGGHILYFFNINTLPPLHSMGAWGIINHQVNPLHMSNYYCNMYTIIWSWLTNRYQYKGNISSIFSREILNTYVICIMIYMIYVIDWDFQPHDIVLPVSRGLVIQSLHSLYKALCSPAYNAIYFRLLLDGEFSEFC